MAVQWGLAQGPNAFERNFQQGFQLGEYQRQRREETEQRNALAAYAANPNEQSLNALAQFAPEVAIQERRRMQQAAQEQQVQQLRAAAAGGDRNAMQQLAAIDPTTYSTLSTQRRQYEQGMVEAASNLAQRVLTLPPEQRAAVYQQQIAILGQRYPELAGQEYSDELMQSTIAEAGQWQEFNRSQQPDYMAIPEGGTLVNTRSPQAVQQFSQSQFPNAPQIGAVEDGYRYRGGNPADPASWEQVGQQMSAPTRSNTPAPALGANGLPSVLTPQQYEALVNDSGGNRAAVNDYLTRMGIRVGSN